MENEKKQIGFVLQGIKTEQFAILEDNYTSSKNVELGTSFEFKINEIKKIVGVFIDLEYVQDKKLFIKLVVSCHFQVLDDTWLEFLKEENKITIPKNLLIHLAIITTGTARGVLFSKTESTEYSKFFLPTLDITKMIEKDAVFNMV